MKLLHIQQQYEQLIDTDLTVNGWVLSVRSQKDLSFIKLTDGSSTNGIQLVYEGEISLPLGSSISAQGVLIRSPAKGQPYELKTNQITIIGPKDLPIKLVPNCWTKNRAVIIRITTGSTGTVGLIN